MEALKLTSADEALTIVLSVTVDPARLPLSQGTVIDVDAADANNDIELVSGEYYTLMMKRTDTGDYKYSDINDKFKDNTWTCIEMVDPIETVTFNTIWH